MFLQAPTEKLQVIADSVKRLSNYYIDNPEAETPWNDKYCQTAYRHYYLPLNFIRNQLVIKRGLQTDFFIGLTDFIDWGSGPGTASLALADSEILKKQIKKQILFDSSSTVFKVFDDLKNNLINASTDIQLNLKNISNTKNSCLIFSYSLTEVSALPAGWNQFEALMILEPSTSEDGRKLLHTRNLLIENGYTIWAPCTHQLACPLLIHSKNDWCHDRAHVKSPAWFTDLEKLLPMKNKTVTTSYLLARKTKPTNLNPQSARLTGDSLAENGKTRQLVCRNEQREYLAWMHKSITPQTLARGEMLDLPLDIEMKSNELRVKTPLTTK